MSGMLRAVTGKLKEIASDIVTVRLGTVISDNAPMAQTVVILDNDPDSAQVQALSLNGTLPAQTRVMMLAYPPRGLVIIGTTAAVPPMVSGAAEFVFLSNGSFTATQAAPFRSLIIEDWGGGGGGGGTAGSGGVNTCGAAAGGAGCGYARSVVSVASLVFPLAVNVGGAASGGAPGNNAGSTGATNSVIDNAGVGATIVSATGGGGGGGSAAAGAVGLIAGSASPGAGTVGQFLAGGQGTQNGFRISATTAIATPGGAGALGGGGGQSAFGTTAGNAGSFPGGGGAGGASQNNAAAQAGGNGAIGGVAITGIP